MTLLETINLLEGIAFQQPAVNMIVREDIYKLNSCPSCRYGAFGWTEGTHRATVGNSFTTFAFTLFYVDRLEENKANGPEIHSVGVEVLNNIMRCMAEEVGVADWTVTPFSGQKFGDECAGVYVTAEFTVPMGSPCGVVFEEYGTRSPGAFDFSWSDAFQVWIWSTTNKEIYVI